MKILYIGEIMRVINLFLFSLVSVCIFISGFSVYSAYEKDIIYIDPGHGGYDGGSVSNSEVYEKDVVLKVSYFLKEYLEYNGYKVLLTRYDDYDLASDSSYDRKHDDILKRVEYVNNSKAKACISIHTNAFPNSSVRGAQTFYGYGREESKLLAELIQENLIKRLKNTNRVALPIKEKYILDNITCPISIVEIGFLSNKEECKLLTDESYLKIVSYSIGEAVVLYLN